jgi:LmbE family N-acetylglucosaminyl deacetylase
VAWLIRGIKKEVTGYENPNHIKTNSKCAVIVTHPDDETLWAGGLILMHPQAKWIIITICRKSDPDRAPKFLKALEALNASGAMGDLDDGPEQIPLAERDIQDTIMELLPSDKFDLILTHSTSGEYTRHLRHEETAKAVLKLWKTGELQSEQVCSFAYEDGNKKYLPRPEQNADLKINLPDDVWQKKYDIITKIYGFSKDGFEARTTPRQEAFRCFRAES